MAILTGCSKKPPAPKVDTEAIKKLRETMSMGNYSESIKLAREITSQVPPNSNAGEGLYLLGYLLAYYKVDFQAARLPLKQLLDLYPTGTQAADAQKLLADCQYWQGHYQSAGREYKKLLSSFGDRGYYSYAQYQQGNCLLLDDKVGDAITVFRDLVEKSPNDPLAGSAQLIIANSFLKLQNINKAKTELRKLISFTKDQDLQQTAQKALRQIEGEENEPKKAGNQE